MKFNYWLVSDQGKKRKRNEDSGYADRNGLFMVADGLGGHNRGDYASQLAVQSVCDSLVPKLDKIKKFIIDNRVDQLGTTVKQAVSSANDRVYQLSMTNRELSGMGTTLSMCIIQNGISMIGHVGDSRIYLFRKNNLFQITHDHVSDIEGFSGLTRAIGTTPQVKIDLHRFKVTYGDLLLLCSDGLNKHVSDREIRDILQDSQENNYDPSEKMREICLDRGGVDNITILIVKPVLEQNQKAILNYSREVDSIRQLQFFSELDYQELIEMQALLTSKFFDAGQRIINEGEKGETLYIIAEGRVKVSKKGHTLTELEAGDHFGEMSLFASDLRTASIDALEDCICLTLDNRKIQEIIDEDSPLSMKLLRSFVKSLAIRLVEVNSRLAKH